ncbi:hypothetical protein K0M31_017192, partial [Melipona bicolor]
SPIGEENSSPILRERVKRRSRSVAAALRRAGSGAEDNQSGVEGVGGVETKGKR